MYAAKKLGGKGGAALAGAAMLKGGAIPGLGKKGKGGFGGLFWADQSKSRTPMKAIYTHVRP